MFLFWSVNNCLNNLKFDTAIKRGEILKMAAKKAKTKAKPKKKK